MADNIPLWQQIVLPGVTLLNAFFDHDRFHCFLCELIRAGDGAPGYITGHHMRTKHPEVQVLGMLDFLAYRRRCFFRFFGCQQQFYIIAPENVNQLPEKLCSLCTRTLKKNKNNEKDSYYDYGDCGGQGSCGSHGSCQSDSSLHSSLTVNQVC